MSKHVPKTRLRALRRKRDFTLEHVAHNAGISVPHLSMIENGKRGLSYDLAVSIASVFGTTPDEIFLPNELTNGELKTEVNE